jgi:hypothetical protein
LQALKFIDLSSLVMLENIYEYILTDCPKLSFSPPQTVNDLKNMIKNNKNIPKHEYIYIYISIYR